MFTAGKPLFRFRGPWGVPVQIGRSILILPVIFLALSGSAADTARFAMLLLILIGSIFLHELGHAWGCAVQDIPVQRVVLHGGGGFCQYGRTPSPRESELIVAMGPIVNLTLWAVASLVGGMVSDPGTAWIFPMIAMVNLFLAVMNLLPVMPLDGGKLFHLALARFLPDQTATRISGLVGLTLALLWIPAMLLCLFGLGVVLFFIPPIALHWRMMRGEA